MLETTKYLLVGIIVGVFLSLFIEKWIRSFLLQLNKNNFKSTSLKSEKNIQPFSKIKFLVIFSIFTAFLSNWRQLSPNFVNDLILVTALIIIARIDLKTMYIEGKIITFEILVRFFWLVCFEEHAIAKSLAALFFGAGMLYLVSFFYQTLREKQGLGDGDAAVLGLIGFWLGWQDLGIVILIASISGIIVSGLYFLKQKRKHLDISILLKTKIPFAPFLCFGGLLVHFFREINFHRFGLN